MKHIITFSFAIAVSMSALAQTGLDFSQCLTFAGETNVLITGDYYSPAFAVPEGKVWKIEHAYVDYGQNANRLIINDRVANALYPALNSSNFPVWVKAGDSIRVRTDPSNADYFISILEFNAN